MNLSSSTEENSVLTTELPPLKITDRAFKRIREVTTRAAKEKGEDSCYFLRLAIVGGGCNGFQYKFTLEDTLLNDKEDEVFTLDLATLVVDKPSLELLQGAEIDFVEDLSGASFIVHNPNATSSCGCNASFSLF